jgi:outer membrane protein OmpA-like peptidoglycan-associated protein
MKSYLILSGALGLVLAGTGCATKKYVAKTVDPVAARVTTVESKNTEQDKQISDQGKAIADQKKELDEVGTDLSRTKERITDVDTKATAAGQAAQQANQAAQQANQAASNAQRTADQANQGVERVDRTMQAMNKWDQTASVTVLFPVGQATLNKDAKAQLDEFAMKLAGYQRYQVEIQGFTDKTGPRSYNESLSESRAEAVARYLANEHKIPLRAISTLGSGYALPVADDKTRDGRKQNRRVEVRLFVPEAGSGAATQTSSIGQ